MLKVNYKHLLINIEEEKYQKKLDEIKNLPILDFEKIKPSLKYIKKESKKYRRFENIILVGNGGSKTSAWAFYNSLFEFRNGVNFEFLSSCEPELIREIRKKYSKKDTLVLVISKSGTNINSLEPLLLLLDYPVLVITGERGSKLSEIAKIKGWETIIHPEVGGRYSGLTSCGLVPAGLMGLDIKEIYAGAKAGHKKYSSRVGIEKNDALLLAMYLWELEKKGYVEIFSGIYSTALFGFFPLIVQLIHESTGKGGKGQTIFGDYSPESQHHTNQRFFGGKRNVAGLFMAVEKSKSDIKIKVSKAIGKVDISDQSLSKLDGLQASQAMHFDMRGVVENAKDKKIPVVEIWVSEVTEKNMGEFMVFWHYFSVYSSLLRNVNPFDQPEVEDSKAISFNLRMKR